MIIRTLPLGPVHTNCYLVGCEQTRQAVVIDPGWDAETILAEARRVNVTIAAIALTHGHFDHIGAVADLKEAVNVPLIVPLHEVSWLNTNGGAAQFGFKIRPAPPPDRLVKHGDTIDVGTLSLEIRATPGHTAGHVVYVEQAGRVAFVGDVLFAGSIGRTDLEDGDFDTLISSICDQLMTLPDDFKVYPGHGPPTTIGEERIMNPFL